MKTIPNSLFVKLLLSFWICSSLIIATVGILPLIQQKHDAGVPLPPPLHHMLVTVANRIIDNPELLNSQQAWRGINRFRDPQGKPVRLFVVNEHGKLLNNAKNSRMLRRFVLMADGSDHPIKYQFKNELMFGPYQFYVAGEQYSLYGHAPDHRPQPWFFFFTDNKLLTLSLAIFLSGLLCGLLAWHLGRPLRSLKSSADALASGDLSSRVNVETTLRQDEFGQLAKAFNGMADAVEDMIKTQQRLISDISHELRTPLTRLQLSLALNRKKGQETQEMIRIAYEAEQLEKMIAELLELSRVKLNTQERKTSLELAETLGQVLDDAEFEAGQQHKQLNIEIPESITLPIHPKPLSRAVENLLRNAIRYAKNSITICAKQHKHFVEIEIFDDGPGITNESDLEAIFKPFYRPQSARERETGGWGLGLAITQAGITAHDGHIKAENIKPHGLKVTIKLPK
ncbi:ATP-binding protein [uncultured Shewanella sp.]|uniref:ATP-binding protein n=1 Tax=uncultured Shewanella sp. TaxID=173975 RepID=UPI0026349095|nr:ATP-binding protein [uncultured Shewanella sp.]